MPYNFLQPSAPPIIDMRYGLHFIHAPICKTWLSFSSCHNCVKRFSCVYLCVFSSSFHRNMLTFFLNFIRFFFVCHLFSFFPLILPSLSISLCKYVAGRFYVAFFTSTCNWVCLYAFEFNDINNKNRIRLMCTNIYNCVSISLSQVSCLKPKSKRFFHTIKKKNLSKISQISWIEWQKWSFGVHFESLATNG